MVEQTKQLKENLKLEVKMMEKLRVEVQDRLMELVLTFSKKIVHS